MIEALLKALQDATAQDMLGYAGVWLVGPLVTFFYVNQIKRTRKRQGRALTAWQMRGMASLLAFIVAMFFANRMASWPLDKAFNHAITVAFTFPLLVAILLDKIQKVAPDIAEDIGEMPTEFRAADTTEMTTMPNCPPCERDGKDGK